VPCILKSEASSKGYHKNWARLIQKIYKVDPLTRFKSKGPVRVIFFIEDQDIIEKTVEHFALWVCGVENRQVETFLTESYASTKCQKLQRDLASTMSNHRNDGHDLSEKNLTFPRVSNEILFSRPSQPKAP